MPYGSRSSDASDPRGTVTAAPWNTSKYSKRTSPAFSVAAATSARKRVNVARYAAMAGPFDTCCVEAMASGASRNSTITFSLCASAAIAVRAMTRARKNFIKYSESVDCAPPRRGLRSDQQRGLHDLKGLED